MAKNQRNTPAGDVLLDLNGCVDGGKLIQPHIDLQIS